MNKRRHLPHLSMLVGLLVMTATAAARQASTAAGQSNAAAAQGNTTASPFSTPNSPFNGTSPFNTNSSPFNTTSPFNSPVSQTKTTKPGESVERQLPDDQKLPTDASCCPGFSCTRQLGFEIVGPGDDNVPGNWDDDINVFYYDPVCTEIPEPEEIR